MASEAHADFPEAIRLSADLTEHIRSLDISHLMYRAAVIDRQHPRPANGTADRADEAAKGSSIKGKGKGRTEWAQLEILGWSKFVQSLDKQHAYLEQVSR
jgi:hypothetical protein